MAGRWDMWLWLGVWSLGWSAASAVWCRDAMAECGASGCGVSVRRVKNTASRLDFGCLAEMEIQPKADQDCVSMDIAGEPEDGSFFQFDFCRCPPGDPACRDLDTEAGLREAYPALRNELMRPASGACDNWVRLGQETKLPRSRQNCPAGLSHCFNLTIPGQGSSFGGCVSGEFMSGPVDVRSGRCQEAKVEGIAGSVCICQGLLCNSPDAPQAPAFPDAPTLDLSAAASRQVNDDYRPPPPPPKSEEAPTRVIAEEPPPKTVADVASAGFGGSGSGSGSRTGSRERSSEVGAVQLTAPATRVFESPPSPILCFETATNGYASCVKGCAAFTNPLRPEETVRGCVELVGVNPLDGPCVSVDTGLGGLLRIIRYCKCTTAKCTDSLPTTAAMARQWVPASDGNGGSSQRSCRKLVKAGGVSLLSSRTTTCQAGFEHCLFADSLVPLNAAATKMTRLEFAGCASGRFAVEGYEVPVGKCLKGEVQFTGQVGRACLCSQDNCNMQANVDAMVNVIPAGVNADWMKVARDGGKQMNMIQLVSGVTSLLEYASLDLITSVAGGSGQNWEGLAVDSEGKAARSGQAAPDSAAPRPATASLLAGAPLLLLLQLLAP